MRQTRAPSRLPVMIRLTAVGCLLFFVPDLVFAITYRANALFDWSEGGDAIAVMFAAVYIVWGLFLFASAKAPLAKNSGHFGAMLVMAVAMRDDRRHQAWSRSGWRRAGFRSDAAICNAVRVFWDGVICLDPNDRQSAR